MLTNGRRTVMQEAVVLMLHEEDLARLARSARVLRNSDSVRQWQEMMHALETECAKWARAWADAERHLNSLVAPNLAVIQEACHTIFTDEVIANLRTLVEGPAEPPALVPRYLADVRLGAPLAERIKPPAREVRVHGFRRGTHLPLD